MSRAERVESGVQVALMLGVGTVAAAASWAHIVALAATHGQGGWLAYADAAVIETAAVSAGLEIRRRKRTSQPVRAVAGVLVAAVTLQLAAQLAAAEASLWGWLLGAVPAVFFLVLVKLALARRSTTPQAGPAVVGESGVAIDATPPPDLPDSGPDQSSETPTESSSRSALAVVSDLPKQGETPTETARLYWDRARESGEVPTGAELDRVAGTNNYGRVLRRQWLREESENETTESSSRPTLNGHQTT